MKKNLLRIIPVVVLLFLSTSYIVQAFWTPTTWPGNTATYTNGTVTYSTVCCTNTTGNNGSNGNSGNNSSSAPPPPPPPPPPCFLTLDTPVIASGTPSVHMSWTPASFGNINLYFSGFDLQSRKLNVPDNAIDFTHASTSKLKIGSYAYTLSYQKLATSSRPTPKPKKGTATSTVSLATIVSFGGATHVCLARLKVVAKLTQCNDGIDNEDPEDTLIDQQDPGCHTDGNPTNPRTYVATSTTEYNLPTNLIATSTLQLKGTNRVRVRDTVPVRATEKNVSAIYAGQNTISIGWRSATSTATSCGKLKADQCFMLNGKPYSSANSLSGTYTPQQSRTFSASMKFSTKGTYEICSFADSKLQITESSEKDNYNCVFVFVVDDPLASVPGPVITGPATLTATPALVRTGGNSTLSWNTGGRVECTLTGTNADVIDISNATAGSKIVGPLLNETKYTLACTDPGYVESAEATIKILPRIKEI